MRTKLILKEWLIKPWVPLGMLAMFFFWVFTLIVNCRHLLTHHVLHMRYLPALVSFRVIVIKSNLREKGVYCGPQFKARVQFIMMESHGNRSLKQLVIYASTVRKSRMTNLCLQFPFFLIYSPRASQWAGLPIGGKTSYLNYYNQDNSPKGMPSGPSAHHHNHHNNVAITIPVISYVHYWHITVDFSIIIYISLPRVIILLFVYPPSLFAIGSLI